MGVSVGVPLPVPLPVPVTVGELLGVPLFDGVPLSVPVGAGVVEGLAPLEREAVGVALVLEDREGVGLRVVEGVSVQCPCMCQLLSHLACRWWSQKERAAATAS